MNPLSSSIDSVKTCRENGASATDNSQTRMFGTQHLALFVVSEILLNLTPGQDTLYDITPNASETCRYASTSLTTLPATSVSLKSRP